MFNLLLLVASSLAPMPRVSDCWTGRRSVVLGTSASLLLPRQAMELGLVREIGSKALLAGGGALLLYWTFTAVKLVLSARGINPLIKQFFTQVAAGRIDAAYLLTTKSYRQHVNRQQFIRFLAGLKLNKYRNLKLVPQSPN